MVHVLLVLCRSNTSAILMPPGYFGEAAEGVPLHFSELFCYGSERSLQQCQYTNGPSTCSQHQQDLAVTCQGVDPIIIPNPGSYSSMSWIIKLVDHFFISNRSWYLRYGSYFHLWQRCIYKCCVNETFSCTVKLQKDCLLLISNWSFNELTQSSPHLLHTIRWNFLTTWLPVLKKNIFQDRHIGSKCIATKI